MAYRSISQNTTQSSSLVVTPPSGIVDGDILIAWAVSDAATGSISWPAGFTEMSGSPLRSTWSNQSLYVALKVASSESGNYTLTATGGAIVGGVLAVSGREASVTPHRSSAVANNNGNGTPWTITSDAFASATSSTCDIIWIAGSDAGDGPVTHTPPAGMTERADISVDFALHTTVATQDAVGSGATGALAGSGACAGAQAGWDVYAIALADLSAPPSGDPVIEELAWYPMPIMAQRRTVTVFA